MAVNTIDKLQFLSFILEISHRLWFVESLNVCIDLKLKQWNKALDDCEAVLAIQPTNLKGYLRRLFMS